MMQRFRRGLTFKIGLAVVSVEVVTLSVIGFYNIRRFSNEIDQKLASQIQIPGMLMTQGLLDFKAVSDRDMLETLVGETLTHADIIGLNGQIFYSLQPAHVGRNIEEFYDLQLSSIALDQNVNYSVKNSRGLSHLMSLRQTDGKLLGYLYIRVGTERLERQKQQIAALFIAGSTACVGITSLAIILLIKSTILNRIERLLQVLQQVQSGDLTVQASVCANGDEISSLQSGVNVMVVQLADSFAGLEQRVQERTQELLEARNTLEQRVQERTQELQAALENLTATQFQLVQTEKMSSLGQLVAGVAHEINNPVSFIHGNLTPLEGYMGDLLALLELYQQEVTQPSLALQEAIADRELDFIITDLPKTLHSMRTGTQRIQEIVLSLRNFSRMDEAECKPVDLHSGIDSTLMILQHRLKATPDHPEIQVIKQYAELPPIHCYAGQLNQVFMNLLANAIDALERNKTNPKITITTDINLQKQAKISIADNGSGMSEATRQRIFDPFYTTKSVGKGTGLGLSISYQIITEKHRGSLECFSNTDQGTTFVIQIPANHSVASCDR